MDSDRRSGRTHVTEDHLHPDAERLEAFVADELDAAEAAAVRSHVDGCDACQAEVDELRDLFAALARLPRFAPSAGFTDRVMARLDPSVVHAPAAGVRARRRERWRRATRRLPAWNAGLLAACVAVAVGGYAVLLWWSTRTGFAGQALAALGQVRAFDAIAWLARATVGAVVRSEIALGTGVAVRLWAGELGASLLLVVGAGLASSAAAWVLYRNLIHTPTRKPYDARIFA